MDQLNVVFEMDTMDLSCNSKDTKEMKMVETPAEIIKDFYGQTFPHKEQQKKFQQFLSDQFQLQPSLAVLSTFSQEG